MKILSVKMLSQPKEESLPILPLHKPRKPRKLDNQHRDSQEKAHQEKAHQVKAHQGRANRAWEHKPRKRWPQPRKRWPQQHKRKPPQWLNHEFPDKTRRVKVFNSIRAKVPPCRQGPWPSRTYPP